ncbi:hypothetical protein ACLB2K_071575 [Fragaria x ananassa]
MELLLQSPIRDPTHPSTILAFFLLLFSFVWTLKYFQTRTAKNRGPPEAAGAWPILGHLPLLGGPQPPHIILANMADKYGPLFTIKLGVHRALIVSNWDVAKECLTITIKLSPTARKLYVQRFWGMTMPCSVLALTDLTGAKCER